MLIKKGEIWRKFKTKDRQSDGAMISAEFTEGLSRLGIVASTTLPYSPYQNGKQERYFSSLEGRLIAMLEGIEDLSLQRLNQVSQAWVEME